MASAGAIKAGEAFIRIWTNDAEAQKSMRALQGRVKAFADDVAALGARLSAAGAAVAAPFAASAKTFAGFADVMSTVKAVTGAAEADFARLNATAKRLGESTSFTAREAAEGMLALSRAGYSVDESLAAIPGTLDLARAGALGLGEATTIMADTSRSFGLAANEAGRVGDALAKAANVSNTDIHLIGESMKHVAASANLSGQSLDSMSAALAVMANRGIKGDMAGTALRRTLLELADTGKQAKLKEVFNVDTKDAQGNMRDVLAVMKDLAAATAGMGNADKLSLFSELFDSRGMTAAISLTENVAEWERLTGVIKASAGTASQMAKEMDNNLGGSFRLMKSAIEGVQIALGEATEGTLRNWMKAVEGLAQSVSAFVQSNKQLVAGVMKIGGTLLSAGAATFVFGKGMAAIGGGLGMLSKFSGLMKTVQDRSIGLSAAQQTNAAAMENTKEVIANYYSALDELEVAERKVEEAQQTATDKANYLAAARKRLAKMEAYPEPAYDDSRRKREKTVNRAKKSSGWADEKLVEAKRKLALAQARVAETTTQVDIASQRNTQAMEEMSAAMARTPLAQFQQGMSALGQVMTGTGQKLEMARQAINSFGTAAAGALASGKFLAAAGSVTVLAGSVAALAGDGTVGGIAGMVAKVAGLGTAASMSVSAFLALQGTIGNLSATMPKLAAGMKGIANAAAAVGVAVAAFGAGRKIKDWLNDFDSGQIEKDARRENRRLIDDAESPEQAMMALLDKRRRLADREEAGSRDHWTGLYSFANEDARQARIEIDALDAQLGELEDQVVSTKRETAKALAEGKIEANKQAVRRLAEAWDEVLKKLEEVDKQRADRAQDKQFTADTEADPYAAKDQASTRFDEAKTKEADIVRRLHELNSQREQMVKDGADTQALTDIETQIKSTLRECEAAVAQTEVWESFYEKADAAVTRTRESLQKLVEDAKQLDLNLAHKQDDARFGELLKTNWVAAAGEVGQAMARMNAEWIATGRRVAELTARAGKGDVQAQRQLEKVLERRKDLAAERGGLEGRQKDVEAARKDGKTSLAGVRAAMNDEAKRQGHQEWQDAARANPAAGNAALAEFIADLESKMTATSGFAEAAAAAGDYAGVAAYEEQMQGIVAQLSELRGLKGYRREREAITGDFSARAMQAMLRGGGAGSIEKQQLETQQSMKTLLGKLVDLSAPPSVVAID